MISLKISVNNLTSLYAKTIWCNLQMPKYAVAVGRKVGIYDTYAECEMQVKKYPKAKFKKFERVEEAEAFIKQFAIKGTTPNSFVGTKKPFRIENVNPPKLFKLETISPSSDLFALTNKVSALEEKLNSFIADTTDALDVSTMNQFAIQNINTSEMIKMETKPSNSDLCSLINRISSLEGKFSTFITKTTNSLHVNSRTQFQIENDNSSKPMAVSSDLFSLTNRVLELERKLDSFISETKSTFHGIISRLNALENKDNSTAAKEPPLKKHKPNSAQSSKDNNTNSSFELMFDNDGFVLVYTDGACSKNGRMGAQAGIGIWFNDDHPLNISAPVQGPPTNNNAEIQAARVAITQAYHANIKKLTVNTDSKFVINCITQWIHKWKGNDWKIASGGPVKNKDELIELDNAIQLLEAVKWNYVPGHRGVRGNEMADKLARKGASQYSTNVTYPRHAELKNVKYFEQKDS